MKKTPNQPKKYQPISLINMANNAKTKSLTIKLSQEEYEVLQQKAKNNNMPLATYVRERIFYDVPHLEKHSTEFKLLKTISYCAGILSKMADIKFESDKDKKSLQEEIDVFMVGNGVKES